MSEILKCLLTVAPILNKGFISDCIVGVTDKEKFLAYYPAKALDLKIKVGDPLRPGSINYTAVHEGRRVIRKIPREVYGIPYIAVGYPIVEKGQVVGCLATGVSTDREDRLKGMADELSDALSEIVSSTQYLAESSTHLASASQEISASTSMVMEKIVETSKISELIRGISTKTNILGINASIEAARAGAHGAGFSVVAQEIRKLSDTTSHSTTNIFQQLHEMNALTRTVTKEMENTMNFTVEQSLRIQELYTVIQKLQVVTEELGKLAETGMDVQ